MGWDLPHDHISRISSEQLELFAVLLVARLRLLSMDLGSKVWALYELGRNRDCTC